jgi:hypothetical protein
MSIYSLAFAGVMPIGSIVSGLVADQIGTPGSLLIFSIGAVALGLIAPRFRVPHVDEVATPEYTEAVDRGSPHEDLDYEGGPVLVLNTWQIAESDFDEFTALMNQVRLVRLTTGAYRWRLFRSTTDPTRITELMVLHSWEDHVAQHRRLDDAAAALLLKARSYDIADGPITRHLVAIDVENPPGFDQMVAAHDEMHQIDGSIPTMEDG